MPSSLILDTFRPKIIYLRKTMQHRDPAGSPTDPITGDDVRDRRASKTATVGSHPPLPLLVVDRNMFARS